MNLKLVLSCLLICFCFAGKAQRIVTEDFVHLKNGKIIHGDIVKDVPGSKIILLKRKRNSLFINVDTIKVIVRKEVIPRVGHNEERYYDLRTGQPYTERQRPIENKTQDIIYLKNGTTITGHVIDSISQDSLLVRINRTDTIVNPKDIVKINRKEWLKTYGRDKPIAYAYGKRLDVDSIQKADTGKKKFKIAFTIGGQFNAYYSNYSTKKVRAYLEPFNKNIKPTLTPVYAR